MYVYIYIFSEKITYGLLMKKRMKRGFIQLSEIRKCNFGALLHRSINVHFDVEFTRSVQKSWKNWSENQFWWQYKYRAGKVHMLELKWTTLRKNTTMSSSTQELCAEGRTLLDQPTASAYNRSVHKRCANIRIRHCAYITGVTDSWATAGEGKYARPMICT